nr:hypothetical protein [Tanacetum cinerariifolium]
WHQQLRGHGGNGDGGPPPPSRQLGTGYRGSGALRGWGGRDGRKKGVCKATKNIDLKKAIGRVTERGCFLWRDGLGQREWGREWRGREWR